MTDEEYAAAQAALREEEQRRAAEKAAAEAARIAPLVEITSLEAFADIKARLAALPSDLLADDLIGSSIKAMRVGMDGLLRFAPPPAAPTA